MLTGIGSTIHRIANLPGPSRPGSGGGGGGFSNTKSLAFDGVDEYVETPSVFSLLDGQTSASFSMWINPTVVNTFQYLFSIVRSAISTEFQVACYLDNVGRIRVFGDSTSRYTYSNTGVVSAGVWTHLCITFDLSQPLADRVVIYVNGVDETDAGFRNMGITQFATSTSGLSIAKNQNNHLPEFGGLIDEFAIWDVTLSPTDISTISTAPSDLSLLSTPPNQWYRMGDNSTYQTPQILMPENTNKNKVSNYSLSFDGVDDYVIASLDGTGGSGSQFALGSNLEFTISFWFYRNSSSTRLGLFQWANTLTALSPFILIQQTNDSLRAYYDGAYRTNITTSQNVWYHIAITRTASDNTLRGYLNGSEWFAYDDGGTPSQQSFATDVYFGNGYQYFFNGQLDEISIYNTALTSEQITSIYNGGTPTTISGATAYWKLGEQSKFTDNWLVPNSALSNYSKYSFNFDGVDDYIAIGTTSLGITSAITVSAWVKIPTTNTGGASPYVQEFICEDATSGSNRNWALNWRHQSVSNKYFGFAVWHTDGSVTSITSTGIVPNDGNWHHIMGTFDGTTNANGLKLYVDGTLFQTTAVSTGIRSTSGVAPSIGAIENGNSFRFEGNIDEVAVWDSVQDVSSIYNSGEPTTISGALAHWRMGEEATYNSSTSQWTIPDQVGSNNGTSSNTMALNTLVGEAPNYFGGGVSDAMTIEDRVGDAPNSSNNAVSYNMEADDIDNNTP